MRCVEVSVEDYVSVWGMDTYSGSWIQSVNTCGLVLRYVGYGRILRTFRGILYMYLSSHVSIRRDPDFHHGTQQTGKWKRSGRVDGRTNTREDGI